MFPSVIKMAGVFLAQLVQVLQYGLTGLLLGMVSDGMSSLWCRVSSLPGSNN